MVSRSPGLAVTLNSKVCPGQMSPALRALSFKLAALIQQSHRLRPIFSSQKMALGRSWEDAQDPRFLGAPTRELSAPVGSPMAERGYSRRQLLANAAIAALRVAS